MTIQKKKVCKVHLENVKQLNLLKNLVHFLRLGSDGGSTERESKGEEDRN